MIVAIIPIGSIDGAKSRLGAVLDAEERRDLVTAPRARHDPRRGGHARHRRDDRRHPDDEVRELALRAGARPLRQRSRGLNDGLREARDEAMAAGAGAILDPAHRYPARLGQSCSARSSRSALDASGPLVAIVPDRHDRGTNALLLAPPDVIDFCFGGDSKAAHIEAGSSVPGANAS